MTDIRTTTVEVEETTAFTEDVTNTEENDNVVEFDEEATKMKKKKRSRLGAKIKATANRVWHSKPMTVVKTGVVTAGVVVGVTLVQCLVIDSYASRKSKKHNEIVSEEDEATEMIDADYEETTDIDTTSEEEAMETETEELGV